MNEEVPNVRERILEIFESVREVPGAPFDAEHFVQYLIANPDLRIDVRNTSKGTRNFFRFMRTIEEEFTICFSLKDDELKSLGQWVDRVTYLRSTPKSSLTTIANRMKEPPPDIPALAVAVVFLIGIAFAWKLFSAYSLFLLVVPITVIVFLYRSYWEDLRYYSNMKEKIMSRSGANQKRIG